jgi:Ca2+/Na+ antiporter
MGAADSGHSDRGVSAILSSCSTQTLAVVATAGMPAQVQFDRCQLLHENAFIEFAMARLILWFCCRTFALP